MTASAAPKAFDLATGRAMSMVRITVTFAELAA
jgi:hypothetical protein